MGCSQSAPAEAQASASVDQQLGERREKGWILVHTTRFPFCISCDFHHGGTHRRKVQQYRATAVDYMAWFTTHGSSNAEHVALHCLLLRHFTSRAVPSCLHLLSQPGSPRAFGFRNARGRSLNQF